MRSVILYASLLGVALVGSYLTWTADEVTHTDSTSIPVYRASEGDVKEIHYEGPDLKVVVQRRKDAKGSYSWVTVDERKEVKTLPKHDHGLDDGHGHGEDDGHEDDAATDTDAPTTDTDAPAQGPAEPEVEIEEVHLEFRGNDNADGLLTAYEPLMAKRELDPDSSNDEVFGFDEDSASIMVVRQAGNVKLELGGETYGARDRYARENGRVLLLASTTVKPLQFATSRLIERRLHPWVEVETDKFVLTWGDRQMTYVQKHKEDRKAAFWTRNDVDSDEIGAAWIDRFLSLRATQHGTLETVAGLDPMLIVDISVGDETHQIKLYKSEDDHVYAYSDYLRGYAEISKADGLVTLADLDEVFQE